MQDLVYLQEMVMKLLHELGQTDVRQEILRLVPRVRGTHHPVIDSLTIVDDRLVSWVICQEVLDIAPRALVCIL